jgi:hypothetical protein
MENKQLELLLSYTVFHIGVYLSLFTALIGVAVLGKVQSGLLRFSVACFLVAGICGAIVGSNISEFKDFASFSMAKIGPWGLSWFTYRVWTTVEHLAFWVGILPIVGLFIVKGPEVFKKS